MAGWRNWRVAARCRTTDAEGLFVTGARQREARAICRTCPVRTECLAHALDHRVEFGVWGGMTERERRALLRARPHVRSWAELLLGARTAHHAVTGEAPPVPAPREPGDRRRRHEDRCNVRRDRGGRATH
jgi:WhiB family transcriptional regulator, redox-sensing transcriptional regulator